MRFVAWLIAALVLPALGAGQKLALPHSPSAQDWTSYGGDPGGSKYSPLREVNRENVTRLSVAWIYHTGDISDGSTYPSRSAFEATPLVADGVVYVTTPFNRLIALDGQTGREIWRFDPKIDKDRAENLFISRGVAYWADGRKKRLFLGTLDGRLFSIDATTGKPDDSFGLGGWVDLRPGVAEKFSDRAYGMTSPPAIYKNLVICGSLTADSQPLGPAGDVRAFSALTGKLVWTFHTVAQAGEPGNDTWAQDSWKDRAAANAWAPLTVDDTRGIVFLPLTSPAFDYYGGDRPGRGLFGDSLVALDAATGKYLWYFQTIHHDLWDYDLPAQPNLVEVRREGTNIPAVAQVTKTGFTFLFDRVTGKPLFEIEEVPVPSSPVLGEQPWPTQPRPVLPPPYARQSMSSEELTDVTAESSAYCAGLLNGVVFGRIFTPIGLKPTVLFPGTNGGANWGGASYDPESHTLYVNSMDVGMLRQMVKQPEGSLVLYRPRGSGTIDSRFWDSHRWPCQKPPWGFLTAINLDTGQFRWRSVLGVVDELLAKGLPPTGAPNIGGSLVTAGGLVFIGATNDKRFRAFDKDTGRELWVTKLPGSAHASPMTFLDRKSRRQLVVIAAGGGNKYNDDYSDALIAFALPDRRFPKLETWARREQLQPIDLQPLERTHPSAPSVSSAADHPFSHSAHAALNLDCVSCHEHATSGSRAGYPPVSACMACHRTVANQSPTIKRLAGLAPESSVAPKEPTYHLPDFVFFHHSVHAAAGIACQVCHGNLWQQQTVARVLPMTMKACVDCHRTNRAKVSCTTCHELSQ